MDLDDEELEATRKLHERNNEKSIENAKRECNLYVQARATIQLVDEIDNNLVFKSCDTSQLEIVLQALENSISKDTIREKIEELKEELSHYNEYTNLDILEKIAVIVLESKINLLEKLIYNN